MTAAASQSDARRRRARWPWVLLVVVVVVAALLVTAELVARAVLPGVVRSLVIDELDLPADQQLDVEASGLLLPQLISGTLDELQLSSERVTIGGITGSARVTATAVPIHGGALGSANGTIVIDQTQFTTLLHGSRLPLTKVVLDAPDATVQGELSVLGRQIPVGLTVTPGALDGDLLLTPGSATFGGAEVNLKTLAGMLGDLGAELAAPQRICIAEHLPAGITLTGLRIEGTSAVVDISADGRIAVDAALCANGSCPR